MSERKVLAAVLKSREAYDAIKGHVGEGTFTEQANVVWKAADAFYSRDPGAKTADYAVVGGDISRSLTSPKHRETFADILKDLERLDVSAANIAYDFLAVRREQAGAKLASALVMNKGADEIAPLLEEYEKCQVASQLSSDEPSAEVLQGLPLAEITKTYAATDLIKLLPEGLNRRLDGGLLRGHHVVVFARPEMGKTMFLVNAVAGFLAQGLVVLYVGNEDPLTDIVLRVVSRLSGRNKFEVLDDPAAAELAARESGYDNLILAGLAPGTPREIEALVDKYKPDVLLIDQLRNVAIPTKDGNRVVQLEQAATAARNIAKKFSVLVVSVTQAGDSASGKAVLEMGDVDSSNTGIPAQADVMVGIGAAQEDLSMGRRVLSLPKNKRSGKHEFFPVRCDTTKSLMWSD